MTSPDDLLASLLTHAQPQSAPPVVLDVRHKSYSCHDRAGHQYEQAFVLDLVLAAPGPEDSRYRVTYVDTLPATPDQIEPSLALAQRLAATLGVPLHRCDSSATSWLARQSPSPERPWTLRWHVITWSDDGAEHHADGEQTEQATTGKEAIAMVERQQVEPLRKPYNYRIKALALDGSPQYACRDLGPLVQTSIMRLRAMAHDGHPPSELLEAMVQRAPASTVLERMMALERAFHLDLTQLAPIAAYARGEIASTALDGMLLPLLEQTRTRWALSVALVRAHAEGRAIGPLLRSCEEEHHVGSLTMAMSLREAFSLGIWEIKVLIGSACSGHEDERLEAALASYLAAQQTHSPDDSPHRLSSTRVTE